MGSSAPVEQIGQGLEEIRTGGVRGVSTGLGRIADPFGIDPVGSRLHEIAGDFVDPQYSGGFNEQLAQAPGGTPPPTDPTDPPKPEDARMTAFREAKNALRRRRLSATLLTGGQGALEAPSTASSVLLGT